jgi:hypothetical protein
MSDSRTSSGHSSVNRDRVAAGVVGSVDQDAAHAHLAHLGEGEFGLAVGHAVHHARLLFVGARDLLARFS